MTPRPIPLSELLVRKLAGLTSLRGEDILVQSSSEIPLRYHRLSPEHINVLEAKATLTTLRWRTEQRPQQDFRIVHLVDSLVVMHGLTRGRSSSKKLRRTVMKIGALLLAKKKALSRGDQTKEERKKVRKSLGTLKSLTVQPKTRERYSGALGRFFNFLSREGLGDSVDSIVSDYLEWLWSEGEGRSEASNALAAL